MTKSSGSVWQSAPPVGGSAAEAQTSTVRACVSYQILLYKMQQTITYGRSNQTHDSPVSSGVPDYRMAILA